MMAPDGVEFTNVRAVQRNQLLWYADVTGAPEMVSNDGNVGHKFVPDDIEVVETSVDARSRIEVTISGYKLTPSGHPGKVRVQCVYRQGITKGLAHAWSETPKWVLTRLAGLRDRP